MAENMGALFTPGSTLTILYALIILRVLYSGGVFHVLYRSENNYRGNDNTLTRDYGHRAAFSQQ